MDQPVTKEDKKGEIKMHEIFLFSYKHRCNLILAGTPRENFFKNCFDFWHEENIKGFYYCLASAMQLESFKDSELILLDYLTADSICKLISQKTILNVKFNNLKAIWLLTNNKNIDAAITDKFALIISLAYYEENKNEIP